MFLEMEIGKPKGICTVWKFQSLEVDIFYFAFERTRFFQNRGNLVLVFSLIIMLKILKVIYSFHKGIFYI